MGLRVIIDDSDSVAIGAMYDSTSDWAFGPVIYGDSREQVGDLIGDFWHWLEDRHGIDDARRCTLEELGKLWAEFGGGHE